MNNKDEMLKEFDIDLETADRVAKEYPSLSDSARERMLNKTMKKLNITENSDEDINNNVYEVEKYNRPVWRKFAGIAATIAIIAGSIGGGVYMLHNMNDTVPPIDLSSGTEPDTDIVTIVESSVVTNVPATDATATAVSSAVTETTTEVSETTSITATTSAASTSEVVTSSADTETTTEAAETKSLTPEEIAHKLTDDYWKYECFFHATPHSMTSTSGDYKGLSFDYTGKYDGETVDFEIGYSKTSDERLTDNSMDSLKKLYNTYYSKNYDPFYADHIEFSNNRGLFGPSFTADTLPADGKLDRIYAFVEYEGELYQAVVPSYLTADKHWPDDEIDIIDVSEKSFTFKRKMNDPSQDFTFKIEFDEDVQDWRIGQIDIEHDYDYKFPVVTAP